MKLMFNACPKCSGDLELRRDIYGIFLSCLQCGLQRDLGRPNAHRPNAAQIGHQNCGSQGTRPVESSVAEPLRNPGNGIGRRRLTSAAL